MNPEPAEIEIILKTLSETPTRIASMCMSSDNARLSLRPDPENWSANDILAHLRACADVWGKSIAVMIAQDHPTLRYISPRTWVRKTNYPSLDFRVSLERFASQRNDLLRTLRKLAVADWARGATFTGTVRGREQTVLSYALRMTQHEAEHIEQLESLLKPT